MFSITQTTRYSLGQSTAIHSSDKTLPNQESLVKPSNTARALLATDVPFAQIGKVALLALIATVALAAVVAMVALRAHRKSVP
jgi:hypothetical protein